MAKKYLPVAREFEVGVRTTPVATTKALIYLDKQLSAFNNRLYRQKKIYRAKVSLSTSAVQTEIPVYALAPTWWVINSIKKASDILDEVMTEEIREMGPDAMGRWYDFRIKHGGSNWEDLDLKASQDGTLTTATPSQLYGEYEYSEIMCADGNTRGFKLYGSTDTSNYNIFDEYDALGNVDLQPGVTNTGGYGDAAPGVDVENMQHLSGDGNAPPYNSSEFPNAMWVRVGCLFRDTNGNQSTTTGFFDAPLGIIALATYDGNTAQQLKVEVAGGNYKGVAAHDL